MSAMTNSELTALSPPDFCLNHWIKMLAENPEPVLLGQILNKVASLGRIHVSQPAFSFS
jgi:hypothetical protein